MSKWSKMAILATFALAIMASGSIGCGGGWGLPARLCAITYRFDWAGKSRHDGAGFRVLCEIE